MAPSSRAYWPAISLMPAQPVNDLHVLGYAGWLQSGAQGPRRRSGTQDSLSDDSELDRQGGNSRYAYGYYNPMSTDGEDEEEEEPLSAPLPAAAAGFSSSPNETAAAKRRSVHQCMHATSCLTNAFIMACTCPWPKAQMQFRPG